VNALLTRNGLDPALVDEVIFGCVRNPWMRLRARVIACAPEFRNPSRDYRPAQLRLGCEGGQLAQEKMPRGEPRFSSWRRREHVQHPFAV